jgi:hypothetical protein
MNVIGANNPRSECRRRLRVQRIERKPAWGETPNALRTKAAPAAREGAVTVMWSMRQGDKGLGTFVFSGKRA